VEIVVAQTDGVEIKMVIRIGRKGRKSEKKTIEKIQSNDSAGRTRSSNRKMVRKRR